MVEDRDGVGKPNRVGEEPVGKACPLGTEQHPSKPVVKTRNARHLKRRFPNDRGK